MKKNIFQHKFFSDFHKYKYINISIIGVTIILCLLIYLFTDRNSDIDDKVVDETSKVNIIEDQEKYIEKPDKTKQFQEAVKKNRDTVGWVYIPGTTVDWPVMKGVDNNYYLRKNENKEYAFDGCIFGDDDSIFGPLKYLSNNIVLHGHNLDDNPDGKRFAQLVKFQDMEFAENTPYIFLTIKDGSLVYQIYAVFFTDIGFGYTRVGLDEEMQQALIDSSKARSEYIYDVYVTGKDKIITLSTCTYKYGQYGSLGQENTRFVIQGKLLKGVDKLKGKANLKKNSNPKAPNLSFKHK